MPDVFHNQYRELSEAEKELMANLKDKALELYDLYDQVGRLEVDAESDNESKTGSTSKCGREIALAKTKLEESVMWAVKGLTK